MIHIESKQHFENEIKEGIVIVDFYATWCSPCRMLSSELEEIDEENNYKILKVNVDEQIELASEFKVSSIPYLVFYKNGDRIGDYLGFIPKANIIKLIDKYSNK